MGWIWRRESSPSCDSDRVGVLSKMPESVTSTTVSPMESTMVQFTKETTMYLKGEGRA